MNYEVVFVCQKGFIEIQSLILAVSTRRNLLHYPRIIAAHPENFGPLSWVTLDLFKELDIEVVSFSNDFSPEYCMANKPFACTLPDTDTLFLDSDLICTQSFSPEYLPDKEVVCFSEDPFLAYSKSEWEAVSRLFGVVVENFDKINVNMNTPLLFIRRKDLAAKWLEFTRRLHAKTESGEVTIRRRRKISNICFGMAVRALSIDPHIENPITWNRDPNWWKLPQCECHEWEKRVPVSQRTFSKVMCSPDHVFYYENGEMKSLGLPYFFLLQNGGGYCPTHQGDKSKPFRKIGLGHYPAIRSELYNILSQFPIIDQHPNWEEFYGRYFTNNDSSWFCKPENYVTENRAPKRKLL